MVNLHFGRVLNNINVFNSFQTDMKFYVQIEITRKGTHIEQIIIQ